MAFNLTASSALTVVQHAGRVALFVVYCLPLVPRGPCRPGIAATRVCFSRWRFLYIVTQHRGMPGTACGASAHIQKDNPRHDAVR